MGETKNHAMQTLAGVQYGTDTKARFLCNLTPAMAFGAARGQFDVAAASSEVPAGRRAVFWVTATSGSALYYAAMLGAHVLAKRVVEGMAPPEDPTRRSPVISAAAGSITLSTFSIYAQLFSKTGAAGPLDPALWFGKTKAGPRSIMSINLPRTASAAVTGAVLFGSLHAGGWMDL